MRGQRWLVCRIPRQLLTQRSQRRGALGRGVSLRPSSSIQNCSTSLISPPLVVQQHLLEN